MSRLSRSALPLLVLAALVAGTVTGPAGAASGPTAKASKCKKAKKNAKRKRKKRCGASGNSAEPTLPGQHTKPTAVSPLDVDGLILTIDPVLGGTDTQGQVFISGAAPQVGQVVALQSSDPTRASLPSTVKVVGGQTSATFPITTTAGPNATPTITASIGSSAISIPVHVVASASVSKLQLSYRCFPSLSTSFPNSQVDLDVVAPQDTPVSLQSSDTNSLTVPTSVTVPTGAQSATFSVNTTLAATPQVTVTASLGASSAQDTVSVRNGASGGTSQVTDMSVPGQMPPDGHSTGSVTLDCEALAPGTLVTLQSDNPDVSVPAGVLVLPDSLTASFQIDVAPNVSLDETATITATTVGGGSVSRTILVGSQPT